MFGIEGSVNESWTDTENKARWFIKDELNMPSMENVEIERAHRVGSRNSDTCPSIVKFSKFKVKDDILQKG